MQEELKELAAMVRAGYACPLDIVPFNLQLLVAEKMPYKDFATFNRCSKSSAAVCDKHPAHVGIHFEKSTVRLNWHLLSKIPPYVRVTCYFLHLTTICDLNLIKRHLLKVEQLHIQLPKEDYGFLQHALKLIKPRALEAGRCTKAILSLPEVQEVSSFTAVIGQFNPFEELGEIEDFEAIDELESTLLRLKASFLHIHGVVFFTLDGTFNLIQQWMSGSRKIESIFFGSTDVQLPDNALDRLLSLFDANKFAKDPKLKDSAACICRSEDHSDCIMLDLSNYGGLRIDRIKNGRCPAAQWKQLV